MSVEVRVRKRIGGFAVDASFTGRPGITALFGRSGAGKTSIVNMIAGLTEPDGGRIVVGDRVLFDRDRRIDLPPERRRLGYVFQEARLFTHLSVQQNLLYGWRRLAAADRYIPVDRVVDLLGLSALLSRSPRHLSGGERQRVAIGRALLCCPQAMLMDEPLASLDSDRKAEIIPYVEHLRDEFRIPILYVSHSIEEVVRLADTLVLLSDGGVVASGSVEELMSRIDLYPYTGRYEAGAVIAVQVSAHDPRDALTVLSFDGGRIFVPSVDLPIGAGLRVRIRARDVALAVQAPEGISIRNVLRGRVSAIAEGEGAYAEVRLKVGGAFLVARVTRQAVRDLGIAVDREVHALIKSVAIDRQSLGLPARQPGNPVAGAGDLRRPRAIIGAG